MGSQKNITKDLVIDSEGFLASGEEWNEDIARIIATQEGLDSLNDEQMEIIIFMRKYFLKYKVFPILNNVCKIVHQPKQCVNEQFINPEIAWKIAGLPKQDGIHFISMDGKNFKMEACC